MTVSKAKRAEALDFMLKATARLREDTEKFYVGRPSPIVEPAPNLMRLYEAIKQFGCQSGNVLSMMGAYYGNIPEKDMLYPTVNPENTFKVNLFDPEIPSILFDVLPYFGAVVDESASIGGVHISFLFANEREYEPRLIASIAPLMPELMNKRGEFYGTYRWICFHTDREICVKSHTMTGPKLVRVVTDEEVVDFSVKAGKNAIEGVLETKARVMRTIKAFMDNRPVIQL